MLFLGIISWKGGSRFNGRGCFSDGEFRFYVGVAPHMGAIGFDEGGGFAKNRRMQGVARPCPLHYGKPWRRVHTMQTTLIKKQITKKKKKIFLYIQRTLNLAYFPHFGDKTFFSVIHNTTWAPNTMLSSWKKLKSQFHENLSTERRTDLIHMTPLRE